MVANLLILYTVFRINISIVLIRYNIFVETFAKTGMVLVGGEITSNAVIDYQKVIRDTIKDIGFDDSSKGFNLVYLFLH